MGTSTSGKGRGNNKPLVPSHADADPGKPLPEPQGQRFRGFRTEFGKAVAGTGGTFRAALGRFARDATGGAGVGPRRFGPAYVAGGSLVELLTDLQGGGTGEAATGSDLSGLVNQPLEIAAEAIANRLAPNNADRELVRVSLQEAIAEALPDVEVFDPASLTPDNIIALLVEFFTQILFREITLEAGDAWNKAETPQRAVEAENELKDIIHASVDRQMSPALAGGLGAVSRAEVERLQRSALEDIWREWSAGQ